MRKLKSGGVTVSKRPRSYDDLKRWDRTFTCYSGIIGYRFLFLDSVTANLRLEYEFRDKSRILLKKHNNFNVTEFPDNKFFNVKSTLLKNDVSKELLIKSYLATDFYANIKQVVNGSRFVSNFAEGQEHIFWTIVQTETINLVYDRKPKLYSEWDQLLGPITLSEYDRMHFEFSCLKGLFKKSRSPQRYFF